MTCKIIGVVTPIPGSAGRSCINKTTQDIQKYVEFSMGDCRLMNIQNMSLSPCCGAFSSQPDDTSIKLSQSLPGYSYRLSMSPDISLAGQDSLHTSVPQSSPGLHRDFQLLSQVHFNWDHNFNKEINILKLQYDHGTLQFAACLQLCILQFW